jgi:predicted transcriptional regulator
MADIELTREKADQIEDVRAFVEALIEYDSREDSPVLDHENLVVLEAQLDGLHQAVSVAVAQKQGIEETFGGEDDDE